MCEKLEITSVVHVYTVAFVVWHNVAEWVLKIFEDTCCFHVQSTNSKSTCPESFVITYQEKEVTFQTVKGKTETSSTICCQL